MGTKRSITHLTNNNEDNLSVPPGFVSLTSLTLKRMVTGRETADPMNIGEEFSPGLMSAPLSNSDIEKFKNSFKKKPWICHDQVDRVPQRFDSEQTETHKVTARWHPVESSLPELEDAPVFRPTEEEFKDTLKYIAKIRSAEIYGICRIVPPPSWRTPCLLKDKNAWEASKFNTHVQKIDGLQNLYLKRQLCGLHEEMKTKMPKFAAGSKHGSSNESAELTSEYESGPEFTLKNFNKYADEFKRQYFCQNRKLKDPDISVNTVQDRREPLIAQIEGEYWRIIENPSEEIEVLCGTGLGSRTLGSGFPITASPAKNTTEYFDYVESGWNLNNIPKLPGTLLPFGCEDTPTITIPQLFIGMCFASQWWRNEQHHLYSLSYMHLGDPKVWYSIPGRYFFKFVEVVKDLCPQLSKHPQFLHELGTQLSPSTLISKGIPVYRCVQNPMEFVVIFPGAYHSEFSCGFNCSEAVCFAPFDWLPHGQNIVELYAEYCLRTSISHDRMLLEAAIEAVNAHWESFATKKDSFNNQLWRNVSWKDGILTRALKSRIKNESIRREHLCNQLRSRPFDELDVAVKRECCICLYDLYLSAVGCSCSPNRYSCLRHGKQLCPCAWGAKVFYFRYRIAELNLLVKALEGNLKAIHSWAKRKAQPDASQQLNPGDKGPAAMGELKNPSIIISRISADSSCELNGAASNKMGSDPACGTNVIAYNNVMPAFGTAARDNEEHKTTTTMFPRPDTSVQNDKHQSASSMQNFVKSPVQNVIILSDDEDEPP